MTTEEKIEQEQNYFGDKADLMGELYKVESSMKKCFRVIGSLDHIGYDILNPEDAEDLKDAEAELDRVMVEFYQAVAETSKRLEQAVEIYRKVLKEQLL